MIHLDTSFLIRALAAGTGESDVLHRWISEGRPVAICAVALCEFLCGAEANRGDQQALDEVLGPAVPIGAHEAEVAARLFNESGRRRHSLNDCLIAAAAMNSAASLATCDPEHFRRFVALGLRLELSYDT